MGRHKLNCIGSIFDTKCGPVEVIRYYSATHVVVKFLDTGTIVATKMNCIRDGNVKDPYKPSVQGIGYIGSGIYTPSQDGENTRAYSSWVYMLNTYKEDLPIEYRNFQTYAHYFYEVKPNEFR